MLNLITAGDQYGNGTYILLNDNRLTSFDANVFQTVLEKLAPFAPSAYIDIANSNLLFLNCAIFKKKKYVKIIIFVLQTKLIVTATRARWLGLLEITVNCCLLLLMVNALTVLHLMQLIRVLLPIVLSSIPKHNSPLC